MSKLITDSDTLLWLTDPGVGENDSNLFYKAEALKKAALACSMRRIELRINAYDEQTQALFDDTVCTLIDTYHVFEKLLNELDDIVNKRGGAR